MVTEDGELSVGDSLLEPLDRGPLDVFRNAAAFLLGEGSEDGKHQLAVPAHGIDVLFLEPNFHADVLQMPYRVQQVDRVPGKALDRLREDDVDTASFGVRDHSVEVLALAGPRAGDTVVCIDTGVFPLGVLLDEGAVVADLGGE